MWKNDRAKDLSSKLYSVFSGPLQNHIQTFSHCLLFWKNTCTILTMFSHSTLSYVKSEWNKIPFVKHKITSDMQQSISYGKNFPNTPFIVFPSYSLSHFFNKSCNALPESTLCFQGLHRVFGQYIVFPESLFWFWKVYCVFDKYVEFSGSVFCFSTLYCVFDNFFVF